MTFARRFFQSQRFISRKFDSLLPISYRIDGNRDFRDNFAPRYLGTDLVVLDVGGGKKPFLDLETKRDLRVHVIGVDVDFGELKQAPPGAYDEMITCDIARLDTSMKVDLAICQAVLEHVSDTDGALASIAGALKPGGRVVLFVPSRNAVFARLNLVLPESWKRWILFRVFPQTKHGHGFSAYYDRCTPREIRSLAESHGLFLLEKRTYYLSRYFSFLFPLYLVWRIWMIIFRALAGEQAAETFSMAFEKPRNGPIDIMGKSFDVSPH